MGRDMKPVTDVQRVHAQVDLDLPRFTKMFVELMSAPPVQAFNKRGYPALSHRAMLRVADSVTWRGATRRWSAGWRSASCERSNMCAKR